MCAPTDSPEQSDPTQGRSRTRASGIAGLPRRRRRVFCLLLPALLLPGLVHAGAPANRSACPDQDEDGYADCTVPGCDPAGLLCGDCDDDAGSVNPGAVEVCNHRDDDCNSLVDEGSTSYTTAWTLADPARTGAFFARSVAVIGDVNGDGVEEFVAGKVGDHTAGSWEGAALLFSGADRSLLARAVSDLPLGGGQLGNAVSATGDIDGDGTPDFAAAAYLSDGAVYDGGEVLLFSGDYAAGCPVLAHLRDDLATAYDHLGEENGLAAGVDWSGDGTPEILAGAMLADHDGLTDAGQALVFDGATGAVLWRLRDPDAAAYDNLGVSVATIGDVTGDGTPDIAVGESREDGTEVDQGAVLIFSGATGGFVRRLTDPLGKGSDYFGWAVDGADDIDGDGTGEIAVSARNRMINGVGSAGEILVLSGADGSVLWRWGEPAPVYRDYLGWSLRTVADSDGDGLGEVLAGAPYATVAGIANAGRALLLSGADGSLLRRLERPDEAADDNLGFSVDGTDLTGDGVVDLLVGCSSDDIPKLGADSGTLAIFVTESDCDGDGVTPAAGDCDDSSAERFPGHEETCDGLDNDCNQQIDEDVDGDGYDACEEEQASCGPGANGDPLLHPGAEERCNGKDDDCDGSIDEGPDGDGDTYAAPCDCDDGNGAVHPGATEECNHVADACGAVDEGFTMLTESVERLDRFPKPGDQFGVSLAPLGDIDGDSIPDFAVGSSSDDTPGGDAGQVTVYSGRDLVVVCRTANTGLGNLGKMVVGLDDLDGDGTPDFAAAAGQDTIVLYSGSDCREISRCGLDLGQYVGLGDDHGLALGRDWDGDGVREILAGATRANLYQHHGGAAYVFGYSRATGLCTERLELTDPLLQAYDWFGFSLAAVDDLSGDGTADILVGEPGDDSLTDKNGAVLLFSGADGAFLRRLLDPEAAWRDYLGQSVAGAPDLDGDGWPEVLAGAEFGNTPVASDGGHVVIFSGRDGSVLRRLYDPTATGGERAAYALVLVDDCDGDGLPDVVASERYADVGGLVDAGRAIVLSTAEESKLIAVLEDPTAETGTNFGVSVASAGDLSGDGVPEFLVGAPYKDGPHGTDTGAYRVFSLESDCDEDGAGPWGQDCDDQDSNLWRRPGQARDLMIEADHRSISWLEPEDPGQSDPHLLYDTMRSSAPAGFDEAVCLESDDGDLMADDPSEPSTGEALYYLVRAQNDCGEGDLGTWGPEQWPRSARACP